MVRFFLSFLLIAPACLGQHVTFTPVATGIKASFRGLSVVSNKGAWVSGSNGWVGSSVDGGYHWAFTQLKGYEKLDFRSIYAFDETTAIIANAGSPANILKTGDGGATWKQVYFNNDREVFLDGVDFWNKKEGIVFGDPINSKLLVLKTVDRGEHWLSQEASSPMLNLGEASFAASGTTIRCLGKKTVAVATGGKTARLWRSNDKGNTWEKIETPMLQGTASQGIFSVAFKDLKTAVIVGGDFQQDSLKRDHVFFTLDGGATWHAPATATGGYREGVEYITSRTLIATGPTGTDVSFDGGQHWKLLNNEKAFHVIRKARNGELILMAGGDGKISLVKVVR